MSLKERSFGYELSELEKVLIFQKEDIGFVRYAHKSGKAFYLDPSPFLLSTKREIFVTNTNPPPEGELVEVVVREEKDEIIPQDSEVIKIRVKIVESWKRIDPKSIIKKRSLILQEDFVEFFKMPYVGVSDLIDGIGISSALFTVSSPPIVSEKGGVNTAVFGKRQAWSSYNRIMQVIPNEFKKATSPYYYCIQQRETRLNPVNSMEVNLSFCNPRKVPMHVLIPLEVKVKRVNSYEESFKEMLPLVRAYMLQSLLLKPEIPEWCYRTMQEAIYELMEDVKGSGFLPCKLDLGTLIPRIATSIARLHVNTEVERDYFKNALDLWLDMYYRAVKLSSTPLEVSKLYRLDDNARKLYVELVELGAVDNYVSERIIRENTSVPKWFYSQALEELRNAGLVVMVRREGETFLSVVDFK